MRPFVELEGVGVSYGEVRVLDGINLTVEPGDFLGIIGPNGSGKTTLLRVMLGLLEPQEGSVRLFGRDPQISVTALDGVAGFVEAHEALEKRESEACRRIDAEIEAAKREERAEAIGGQLRIESGPKGTRVRLEAPVE